MQVLSPWSGVGYGLVASAANISATAVTTNQTLATCNVGSGAYAVQDTYQFDGYLYVSRGATTTAANLVVEFLINTTVMQTATLAITTTTSQNRFAHVQALGTVRSLGISGSLQTALKVDHDVTGTAGAVARAIFPAPGTGHPSASLLNTTIVNALQVRARMSAAVAGLTIYCTHAFWTRPK